MGKRIVHFSTVALPVTVAVAIVLLLGGVAATIAQNDGPTVSVSTDSPVANQRINLTATGFTADAEIGEVAAGKT